MLIVVLVVFVILFCVACAVDDDGFAITVSAIAVAITIIAILVMFGLVVNGRVIDAKIEMYEEENTKIETSINELIVQYMKYESDTLIELKDDSAIALVSLYPELKTDELVKTQIEIYQTNNQNIRALRAEKLNLSNYKWWLYFGK